MTDAVQDSLAYIRGYYDRPAEIGVRVLFKGLMAGTIVGASGQYLKVQFDDPDAHEPQLLHPVWEMMYCAACSGDPEAHGRHTGWCGKEPFA